MKGRKRFFFEKKKQKTFGPAGPGTFSAKSPSKQSFFCFFFVHKKEVLTCFYPFGLCESIMSRTLFASASKANGLVITCIPRSRRPLPITAFSA